MALQTGILNEYDREKIAFAIKSYEYTITDKLELAKMIYVSAFSVTFSSFGTPEEVIKKIFTEKDGTTAEAAATSAEAPSEKRIQLESIVVKEFEGKARKEDLITGDILLIGNEENAKSYIYNGKKFCELTKPFITKHKTEDILNLCKTADKYALLRPSLALPIEPSTAPLCAPENEAQEAVIETAKSYLLRGYRFQYDDTTICDGTFRWQIAVRSPEEYTSEYWGYSNCAAFAIDTHRYSLGYETTDYATRHLHEVNPHKVFIYEVTDKETEEEKKRVKEEFYSILRPADIINIRYSKKDGGHAMIYVGNGNIIHSAGQNYNYNESCPNETYEPTVRMMSSDFLFTEGDRRYVFDQLRFLEIVRPINAFNGVIPENTVNRLKNLRGVMAEKLCSKKRYNIADRGEEITFSFLVYNSNDEEVTLKITDTVPNYTEYIGGAEEKDGDNLSWVVRVKADERVTVSYTVKVKEDAPYGEFIRTNNAKVGGVTHSCHPVYINKALTEEKKNEISEAAKHYAGKGLSPIECINEIYRGVLGADVIPAKTVEEITDGLFDVVGEKNRYSFKKDSLYAKMIPSPCCFGGRNIKVETKFDELSVRMLRPEYLMAGDIILSVKDIGTAFYICTNDGIINLESGEYVKDAKSFTAHLLATNWYFAVLRPSQL